MRFYTFCNYYLSSIQQGIQSAHCMHEMFVHYHTYPAESKARLAMWDWAAHHKTMVVLNGGNSAELAEILNTVIQCANEMLLPYDAFREDGDSLNGALTCVGVVVPEPIYMYNEAIKKIRRDDVEAQKKLAEDFCMLGYDIELAGLIASCPLAR